MMMSSITTVSGGSTPYPLSPYNSKIDSTKNAYNSSDTADRCNHDYPKSCLASDFFKLQNSSDWYSSHRQLEKRPQRPNSTSRFKYDWTPHTPLNPNSQSTTGRAFFNHARNVEQGERPYGYSTAALPRYPEITHAQHRRQNSIAAGINLRPVVWDNEILPKFISSHYEEHPEVARLSDVEAEQIFRSLEVSVEGIGRKPPKPIQRFDQAPFPEWIFQELRRSGFSAPYPIQCVGWPVALSHRDMIGIAQTGSGKTLAYLLPAIFHVTIQLPLCVGDGPLVLILVPTRELALQIQREAVRFTKGSYIRVACVFGGVPRRGQATELRRGVHICIGTPGRLLDFLESSVTDLKRVSCLIIDEADRMLDMGFEFQMRQLVSQIQPDRQTLMWSATWPRSIQKLACDFCKADPVKVTAGAHDLQANGNIIQIVEVCDNDQKLQRLLFHLNCHAAAADAARIATRYEERQNVKKTLIFCETKVRCDALCAELRAQRRYRVAAVHGSKGQRDRDRILNDFRAGHVRTLIATDVASRGLDIQSIDLVINFDVPKTIEDYIHRIGRTGRAGATGTAITLFTTGETKNYRMARQIINVMSDVGQEAPVELKRIVDIGSGLGTIKNSGYRMALNGH